MSGDSPRVAGVDAVPVTAERAAAGNGDSSGGTANSGMSANLYLATAKIIDSFPVLDVIVF